MNAYVVWWIVAAALVGAELPSGTFYLLAVGVAFAAGGFVAILGGTFESQLAVASGVALVGSLAAHRWRLRAGRPAAAMQLIKSTQRVQEAS